MAKTDYEKYIRTDEILALQKTELATHDELQFQIVHQAAELWMKLLLHEFDEIKKRLERKNFIGAHTLFARTATILEILSHQLDVFRTMSPSDYHIIRTQLGKGSGQESPGFNAILAAGPTLWPCFANLLKEAGVSLVELHDHPHKHPDLFLVAEDLFTLDELFLNFRYLHLQLVRRIIGGDVPSLKGVHAEKYLTHGMQTQFFPELWAVRNEISRRRGIPVGRVHG